MDLFILRHGEAGKRIAPGHNDARRPLTVAGEEEITEIAEALERIGIRFDIILTSPLKRAYQTADIVAKEFKAQKKMQKLQELSPEGNRSDLYEKLSSFKEGTSILVVGHNPYLSEMVSEMMTDKTIRTRNNHGVEKIVRLNAGRPSHCWLGPKFGRKH